MIIFILHVGDFLLPGQYLQDSQNNRATFGGPNNRIVMSNELYVAGYESNPSAVGAKLLLQRDGNLVILDKDGNTCWSALSWSALNYRPNTDANIKLVLEDNGNLNLYTSSYRVFFVTWPSYADYKNTGTLWSYT